MPSLPADAVVHSTGPDAREMLSDYLAAEDDNQPKKWAGIAALAVHFMLFLIIIPTGTEIEPVRLTSRSAATVVKRYKPPSPPARARKTVKKRPVNPVPIPDPTPQDPEPIIGEYSDVDFGDPSADFVVGLPDAPPGMGGSAWDGAYRMGEGGVIPPILVRQVLPEYTPEATRHGIQGEVYIEAVVTVDGTVIEPKLIRGLPDDELNERALASILQWQFKPGIRDGEPVPVIALFTVTFRIH
jgi:TonB family protein